jgi:hypothetical protein
MTPSQLAKVETGKFVGEYKVGTKKGEKASVLAINEGRVPSDVADQVGASALSGAEIYKFEPISDGDTLAVAAIDGVRKEDNGHVSAHLQLAVGGGATALHTEALSNPLLEGRSRFTKVFSLLTQEDGVDQLRIREEDTNLTREELNWLGFSTVENSDMLSLDLEPIAA